MTKHLFLPCQNPLNCYSQALELADMWSGSDATGLLYDRDIGMSKPNIRDFRLCFLQPQAENRILQTHEGGFQGLLMYTKYDQGLLKKRQGGDIKKVLQKGQGFRFSCTACGNCCYGEGNVYFTAKDLERIYRHLGLKDKEKQQLYKKLIQKRQNGYYVHEAPGPCYLLDSEHRCSVYPVRPQQCRSFPFWPSVFSSPQYIEATRSDCPGMLSKKGKYFSPGQIAKKINDTRAKFIKPQTDPNKHFML